MRYLYLLIFLFVAGQSLGQTSWLAKGGPTGGEAFDVEYYPGTSTVWAVVFGKVYKSTNDGVSWTRPVNTMFDDVAVNDIEISNNTIYFLTHDQLFTSTDQGVSINSGPKGQFFDARKIKRLPVSGGLVILSSTGSPDIYHSSNNGISWTAGYNGTSVNTNFLAVNNVDQIFILVSNGTNTRPFRSADGGQTFIEQSNGVTAATNVFSLSNAHDGSQVSCVTATGMFATTTGATWTSIKGGNITDATISDGGGSFMGYTRDNLGMYFLDSFNSKVYSKTISGAASTWVLQASNFPVAKNGTIWPAPDINAVTSANFPANTSRVVFGTSVGIFRSATGGASNPDANAGIAEWDADQTIATSNGTLLAATNSTGLLRSENSGDTWTRVTGVPFSINTITNVVTGAVPINGMTQVVLGNNGLAYYSNNHGETWTAATQTGTFQDLQGGDNQRAFARSNSSIYYSANGGLTFGATPMVIGGSFPDDYTMNDMYIPTTTSRIYVNIHNFENGANEYYRINMTYNGSNVITAANAALMANPTITGTVYASNGKLYVYKSSTNQLTVYNGTTWSAPIIIPEASRFFIAANNGYIFLTQSAAIPKVLMSRDDGATFSTTNLTANLFASNVQDVTVSPEGYVFLSTYHSYMYQSKTKVVLPAAPSGFTEVARLANAFIFRWTDNASQESATRVLRSSDGGTNYTMLATIDNSETCGTDIGGRGYYTDNTVVPGATYKYKLRIVNDAGETESDVYSPAAIPAAGAQTLPDNRSWLAQNTGGTGYPVQIPKVVSIQSLGGGKYTVSDIIENTFSSSDHPQEFYVNGTVSAVGGSQMSSTFYNVRANGTGTWNSTTNVLTLKWVRCSDASKTETITYTLQANDPIPAKPTLQALVTNSNTVELSWGTIAYAKNYVIERSTTSAVAGFSQLGSLVAYPGTQTLDNTVVDGTTYYYRVKARNGNAAPQDSPYSDVITVPFKKPNFIISATTVSAEIATTMGSFWADFDGDGNEDLMTVNGTLNGEKLSTVTIFRNLGNGNFEKKAVTLEDEIYSFGAVADINGDGKMDITLAVTDKAQVDFFKGNGDFTFTKFTGDELGELDTAVKSERQGVMWGDINNDGRLDIILSGEYHPELGDKILLCTQNSNGTFSAIEGGELKDFLDDSFSTFWIDYNNDGFTDILISGTTPLRLYKNNGDNTFDLLSAGESGITTGGYIGLAIADYNNDGFMDIFCGGGDGSSTEFYMNDGDGTFTLNDQTAVTIESFCVSPAAADVNNDGLVDILVPGYFGVQTKLFINTTVGSTLSFNAITTEKICDAKYWHIGTAFADYNKDGFVDAALGSLKNINDEEDQFVGGENYLFRNNNTTGNWVQVKLVGVTANKNGLGARITVAAGGKSYSRYVSSSTTFVSLNSLIQHFGLGNAASISSIEVLWPTSPAAKQVISNPAINTILTITQDTYAPEVTSRVPSPGAVGVSTTTKLEINFGETAAAVGGKKITVTGTGDGAPTFNIDVATGVVTGSKITFNLPGALTENKHYDVVVEAGAFVDQFQNKTPIMDDWGFTTSDADPEAPEFTDVSGLPANADKANLGQNFEVGVTDNKGVTSATMFVRAVSDVEFTEVQAETLTTTTAGFFISAAFFDAIGTQYYFRARDEFGNETFSPANAPTDTYETYVKYSGTTAQIPASLIGAGGSSTGWKVIAVPFELGSNNGVQSVFDELTGTNKVDYRIVTYTETPTPAWQDYPDKFSTIDRGAGYFINVKTPVNIIIGDGLVAPSNTRTNLFSMNLKAGWNMIGNPYLEGITWADVVSYNTITGTGATLKKFNSGSYDNGSALAAYEGGFVHMDAAATISIPFSGQSAPGRIEQIGFGPGEWLVSMELKQGDITNKFGGVGMHSRAAMSYDMLDDINAPRWFDFVEMNFSHPEHPVKNFARDVVPVSDEFEWKFEFDSNIPGVATMKWDNETYTIEHDLYLYDEVTQTPVNMKAVSSYSFNASESRRFKIFYGPNALSKIKPAKAMLGLAHPNPTSGTTTVGFSVPEKDGKMAVRLDVFDLTGRRVSTLANGEFEAGFYSAQWQPKDDAAEGMYLIRLFAGDEILANKIILRK